MKKKNRSILKVFFLICGIILPFFNAFSSYNNPRRAAGKRSLNYSGPTTIRQTPMVFPIKTEPVAQNKEIPVIEQIEQKASQPSEDKNPSAEKFENSEERPRVSDTKETKKDIPTAGFFVTAYATIAPLILATLDQALGTAIAQSTKTFIKQSMNRSAFLHIKKNIDDKAKKIVETGEFNKTIHHNIQQIIEEKKLLEGTQEYNDLIQEARDTLSLSNQEKLEITKEKLFAAKKIDDPEEMEQETSISTIFANATQVFILNTIVMGISTLLGYGTKLGLNALMPGK